ncbi:MAG: hypothetical protein K2M22_04850, partial [Lachnospiraceae bacterium]|nr:hypothetical protein [Lachnospiraceae bacterium]
SSLKEITLPGSMREIADDTFSDCTSVERVNEINPIPGSLAFYLFEAIGKPYAVLLDDMIRLALKRDREEQGRMTSFDSNILQNANLSGAKGIKK